MVTKRPVAMPREEPWLNSRAAATYLGVSLRTLYRYVERGELPRYLDGTRMWLNRADLDALVADHPRFAAKAKAKGAA